MFHIQNDVLEKKLLSAPKIIKQHHMWLPLTTNKNLIIKIPLSISPITQSLSKFLGKKILSKRNKN